MGERDVWRGRAARLICLALILAGIYLSLTYAVGIIMPFAVALAVALPLSALSRRCSARLGGSVRAWKRFYLAVTALLGAVLLTLAVDTAVGKAMELIEYLRSNGEDIAHRLSRTVDALLALPSRIPLLGGMEGLGEKIGEAVLGVIESALPRIGAVLGRVLIGTPAALMSLLVTAVATVYLTMDLERIRGYIFDRMSEGGRRLTGRISKSLAAYMAAYSKIFLLTFSELTVGLIILKRPYAILVAFCVALLDLLPMIGSGAVLGAWAAVLIVNGSVAIGVGMIALIVIMAVVRQIAEPRIVGKSLGIHPLVSLGVMYIGFKAFGAVGMLLSPIGAVIAKEILESGGEEKREKVEERT